MNPLDAFTVSPLLQLVNSHSNRGVSCFWNFRLWFYFYSLAVLKQRSRTTAGADDDHLGNFVELVAADTNTFSFIMNYFAETHHPGLDQNTVIS